MLAFFMPHKSSTVASNISASVDAIYKGSFFLPTIPRKVFIACFTNTFSAWHTKGGLNSYAAEDIKRGNEIVLDR